MQTRRVIINPTETAYPGGRGTDQLVVYTRDYGKPTTGTNPYGTEFVVAGGIVTEFGSNNGRIPEDGFVVSGHGEAVAAGEPLVRIESVPGKRRDQGLNR